MSQQFYSGPQADGPVAPARYGKTVLKVAALFLPLCAGVGYWIGSKSEGPKKIPNKEVSVASAPKRPSAPTAVTPAPAPPQPEPVAPKKSETPPKPVAKKTETTPDEMPEPKTVAAKTPPKTTESDPPDPKPDPKPEPKKEDPKPEPKKEAAPTFASLMPLFQMHCASCHGPASKKGGLDMSTLAAVMKGGNNGKVVVAGNLDDSNLWTQVEGDSMPPDGKKKLTDAEKKKIQAWILGGAK